MAGRGSNLRRPRRDADHGPNHERWMVSYADLLTLLLALFIVLYATTAQNTSKLKEMAASMMKAFAGQPPALVSKPASPKGPMHNLPAPTKLPVEAPAVPQNVHHLARWPQQRLSQRQQEALQPSIAAISDLDKKLYTLLQPQIQAKTISISSTPLTIKIRLNAKILFANGAATLTKAADKLLAPLAKTLSNIPKGYQIAIHGYTDDKPIHTTQFPSNWQLSTARALSVVMLFQDQGVAGEALSAEGFSKYHPIASNDTNDGRQQNRRVSIVISAPKPKPSGAASHVPPSTADGAASRAASEAEPAAGPDGGPTQTAKSPGDAAGAPSEAASSTAPARGRSPANPVVPPKPRPKATAPASAPQPTSKPSKSADPPHG